MGFANAHIQKNIVEKQEMDSFQTFNNELSSSEVL